MPHPVRPIEPAFHEEILRRRIVLILVLIQVGIGADRNRDEPGLEGILELRSISIGIERPARRSAVRSFDTKGGVTSPEP